MKNYFTYIVASFCGLMATSCLGVLDTEPLNNPSESVFWKSESDFSSALTACYKGMQADYISWIMPAFDCLTDNGYGNPASGYHYKALLIQQDNFDASTTGMIDGVYSSCYSAIARINIFLDKLAKYDGADIKSVRNQFEGEALFLRSYCYYILWMFYGEVPYVDYSVSLENQVLPQFS